MSISGSYTVLRRVGVLSLRVNQNTHSIVCCAKVHCVSVSGSYTILHRVGVLSLRVNQNTHSTENTAYCTVHKSALCVSVSGSTKIRTALRMQLTVQCMMVHCVCVYLWVIHSVCVPLGHTQYVCACACGGWSAHAQSHTHKHVHTHTHSHIHTHTDLSPPLLPPSLLDPTCT